MNERQQEYPSLTVAAGLTVRGYLSYSGRPGPAAVLFIHGYGSRRDGEKAEAIEAVCAGRGWTFAAFNLRGHGDSDGTLADLRGSALQEDLEILWAYLSARGVEQLFLVGSSMGGWAARWFAVNHPEVVPACTAIAPAFTFPQVRWQRLSEAERQQWRTARRFSVRNYARDTDEELDIALVEESANFHAGTLAARWSTPLLIFHGLLDDVIPYTDTLSFVELAAYPELVLVLLKNGDHRLLAFKEEMARTMGLFFARYWPAPPG